MNRKDFRWLRLRQLDEKLDGLRGPLRKLQVPATGWIKLVRESIGMSAAQLAARLNVNQSTVTRLEKSERNGVITLASLRKAAEALDCELHYVLVPRRSLEAAVRERAARVSADEVARVRRTMALEDQSSDNELTQELQEEHRDTLLRGSWRNLWR